MKVAVSRVGAWTPSKHGEGQNKQVVFEILDETQAKKSKWVKLNITDYETDKRTNTTIKDKWEAACVAGNVLDVSLFSDANVDKFGQFTVVKQV